MSAKTHAEGSIPDGVTMRAGGLGSPPAGPPAEWSGVGRAGEACAPGVERARSGGAGRAVARSGTGEEQCQFKIERGLRCGP